MSWAQNQAKIRLEQYQVEKAKGIEIGNLIRVKSGYKSSDGICKVIKVGDHSKGMSLTYEVKRVIKADGTLVKNSKTTYEVSSAYAQKVDPESLFDEALKTAETVRDHLLVVTR
jgi:hypothetical protein